MGDHKIAVQVHDLTVTYDVKPVLWDIELSIPKGKLVAIIGPNGAGKTTLIKAMLGLIKPITGAVEFEIEEKGPLKNKIGYVPQSGSVDWDFPVTVIDVVMMGRYGHLGWLKRPGKLERSLALETLEKVGMREFASRQISQLSGGQQQRVFLARALIQQAEIYFMDEPFKGVDAQTEKSIIEVMKELKNQGKTIVVVHHDLQTVEQYFDWVTMINKEIIVNGSVEEVYSEENLHKAYGGSGLFLKGAI